VLGRDIGEMLALRFGDIDWKRPKTFKKAWLVAALKAHGVDPHWRKGAVQGPDVRVPAAVSRNQPALA
jgi:hypothetical protein